MGCVDFMEGIMNQDIKKIVFKLAEEKLGRSLTESEKIRVIEAYLSSDISDIVERSIAVLEKNFNISFNEILFETRTINFSLDAIQVLMMQLRKEAAKQNGNN